MNVESVATSVANLRDLGGLPAADGRCVAPGRFFRASHLAGLSADDAAALALRTVVDLRGVAERAAAPARSLDGAVRQLHLPIEPGAVARLHALNAAGQGGGEDGAVRLMHSVYRRFVRDRAAVFGTVLHQLLEPAALPLLVHCTAGKDRTGFAVAVVLLALGVPTGAIEQDYLLSNQHWRPAEGSIGWVTMSRVRAEYLHTALDTMRADFGSTDAYLERALGFDAPQRARLRERLLA